MANEFNIVTQVKADTAPAQKTYDIWKKNAEKSGLNLKFNIDTKSLTSANNELKKINTTTLSTANGFENVSNALAKAQETMSDMARYSEKLETAKMNSSLREMSKVLGDISAPVKETSTTFEKWEDAQGKIITQTRKFDSELGTIITKVEQYKNTLGQTVTETTTFNDNWDKLSHNMEVVDDRIARATEEEKKLAEAEKLASAEAKANAKETVSMGNAMSKASANTDSLANKIVTAAGKVALFKVSTIIVMGFYNALESVKDITLEYDAAMTELKKVWDDSYGSLDDLSKKLSEIGKETANTLTNMTDVATGIVKAGYDSEEDIAVLSEYVAKLQNTADEELTAAEATSILISQLKAYHMEAEEAAKVTDILNAVSAKEAITSGGLSKALIVGSSSMATYNNTIEDTVSLITAGVTTMQNREAQVARGLNTIASRISKNEELLNSYGIALYDAEGHLRSTKDILLDLGEAFETMSDAEQISVGQTLAGVNQYRVFAAVMGNLDIVARSYDEALSSVGYTEQQNSVYMQSLQA